MFRLLSASAMIAALTVTPWVRGSEFSFADQNFEPIAKKDLRALREFHQENPYQELEVPTRHLVVSAQEYLFQLGQSHLAVSERDQATLLNGGKIRALLCADGLLIIDGFVRFSTLMKIGHKEIPVQIVDDWSDLYAHQAAWKVESLRLNKASLAEALAKRSPFETMDLGLAEFYSSQVGKVAFVQLDHTRSIQTTFAFSSLQRRSRAGRLMGKFKNRYNLKDAQWSNPHDGGRSALPASAYAEGIVTSDGILLTDGVHKSLVSLPLGATTLATHIIGARLDLTSEEMYQHLKAAGLTFSWRLDGSSVESPLPYDLHEDDPNRTLVDQLTLKVFAQESQKEPGYQTLEVNGPDYPVLIKINHDVPQMENFAAKELRDAGLIYQPAWGREIPEEIREEARRILSRAVQKSPHPVSRGLKVVPKAELIRDLNLGPWIREGLRNTQGGCEAALKKLFVD